MPPEVIPLIPKLGVEIDGGEAYVDNEGNLVFGRRTILETMMAASDKISYAGQRLFPITKIEWIANAVIRIRGRGKLMDHAPLPPAGFSTALRDALAWHRLNIDDLLSTPPPPFP